MPPRSDCLFAIPARPAVRGAGLSHLAAIALGKSGGVRDARGPPEAAAQLARTASSLQRVLGGLARLRWEASPAHVTRVPPRVPFHGVPSHQTRQRSARDPHLRALRAPGREVVCSSRPTRCITRTGCGSRQSGRATAPSPSRRNQIKMRRSPRLGGHHASRRLSHPCGRMV